MIWLADENIPPTSIRIMREAGDSGALLVQPVENVPLTAGRQDQHRQRLR